CRMRNDRLKAKRHTGNIRLSQRIPHRTWHAFHACEGVPMNVRLGFPQGGTARPMQRPPHRCAGESNYPIHLVESLTLRDGAALTIRPICSDDYQLELDFIRALSARSGYQRLLSPRKLSIAEIQRFVRIDYSRELALIALAVVDGKVQQVAVARYAPEPD